jgi:hypothetical protein
MLPRGEKECQVDEKKKRKGKRGGAWDWETGIELMGLG